MQLTSTPAVLNVAVILGDATRSDPFQRSAALDGTDAAALQGLRAALAQLTEYHFVYLTDHDTLLGDLQQRRPHLDLVFNLCDKGFRNDAHQEPHIPALLELLGLPYTGAGPQSLACCYDKMLVYATASAMGIPRPESVCAPYTEDLAWNGTYPVMVKPNFGDGSFGITRSSVAHNRAEIACAAASIRAQFDYDGLLIVQEFLPGKDLSAGIIGNPPADCLVLPVLEENYAAVPGTVPPIGCYEAKWESEDPGSPYRHITWERADLPSAVEQQIVTWSLALCERLACRDYARVDWRLDRQGNPKLLEVNPNPGWDYWTYLATMAAWAGISYPDMLRLILRAAQKRHGAGVRL